MAGWEDFVNEDIVEFQIDGETYKYKPTTAGEENDWLNYYTYLTNNGKIVQDFSTLNKLRLRNIVEVPFSKEVIKGITGREDPWIELPWEDRWNVFYRLKRNKFNKIIDALVSIDEGDNESKKN